MANSIIISIAGLIPLGVAMLRYAERKGNQAKHDFLRRTARYWIICSSIFILITIIINLVFFEYLL